MKETPEFKQNPSSKWQIAVHFRYDHNLLKGMGMLIPFVQNNKLDEKKIMQEL